jgi:hypothetical protein
MIFALKELPGQIAPKEFNLLDKIQEKQIPSITPVGYFELNSVSRKASVLVTRYLDHSIPLRTLFIGNSLLRYHQSLLDAIAGLLVQLHLGGIYWGDCSLSNVLFRRDAGALQAYLVDAETAEVHSGVLPPNLRLNDLTIMEDNIDSDIADLALNNCLPSTIPQRNIGAAIRIKYQQLWEEITYDELIYSGESYKIQERIQVLNSLGFSIDQVELIPLEIGDQLRLHVLVSDRNYHRQQLEKLTGLHSEEMQARQLMNEIIELKATMSMEKNQSISLNAAANYWLENIFKPIIVQLHSVLNNPLNATELYCQLLEHKWYLSENSHHDVGHQIAADDYLRNVSIHQIANKTS